MKESLYPVYKTGITLAEMPNYISHYIQLADCSIRCPMCHSKELWGSTHRVSLDSIYNIAEENVNKGADMIIIFGDINNGISSMDLLCLTNRLKKLSPICIYSGASTILESLGDYIGYILDNISFLKLGAYKEEFGGLNKKTTNQRMYKVEDEGLKDITATLFWKDVD